MSDFLLGEQRNMLTAAKQFIEFVNKGPSPFHVVDECKNLLRAQGFKELRERDSWKVEKNQKYFVTRNQSTIIAFAVGGEFKPGNGFTMLGAHTDSPCLKVKPKSGKIRHGYHQVGVQLYGGGIWNTWFDRDLTVAGRVLVKEGDKVRHRLVNVKRPILRIPHLAIHLNRKVNDHFGPNLESELLPIIASTVESASSAPGSSKHSPALLDAICSDMGVEKSQLLDFELCLADTQPASIGGALEEFIFAPRLDNLVNAYCGLLGLIESCAVDSLNSDPNIRMALLFDNEEVGSTSAQGAQSSLTEWILRRLSTGGSRTAYEEAIPKSFLVSADQVHACHPNYADKHEDNHKVGLHKGPAIKFNANQRYATTAISASILRVIAEKASVPIQDIVVKNDSPCGSTIGPIISAKLGLRTVDMGSPQLSMHSIREMCCTSSISQSIALFKTYYNTFPAVDESFIVE
ncbi:aspartyl aminopeptidase-like isoform X2 [Antedon mediterranea]|uniref:aspartyl aminopeptidase-like isoform X2 n=1 Tax=Antedon mediterranea TaxID=105859 RepID=UPI003AF41407